MKIEPDQMYVTKEVAGFLRCGKSSIYSLAAKGGIPVIRVGAAGGGVRFMGSDILAFLDSRKEESEPKPRFTHLRL